MDTATYAIYAEKQGVFALSGGYFRRSESSYPELLRSYMSSIKKSPRWYNKEINFIGKYQAEVNVDNASLPPDFQKIAGRRSRHPIPARQHDVITT